MSNISLMSEALSMDFAFAMQKGIEFLLHLKQTILYLDAFTLLNVFCYESITQGLASKLFETFPLWKEMFPCFFDVSVIGF